MSIDIQGTPFYLADEEGFRALNGTLRDLAERVDLLRRQGRMADATLVDYYGETRFAQIAESNALEGSTLSAGETELAVLKGITISGHDPAWSRDAQALALALDELARMARETAPTDIAQLQQLHELILGGRPGAGLFRNTEVRIRGSEHVPPRTWAEVMSQMEHWQAWSREQGMAPTLLRAAVLHAWLEHIHPFIDGNGRVGRAITTLELVRAGYPPIIVRKKDRDIYLDALRRADQGDLGVFVDLLVGRTNDALRDLERAAQRRQGYDRDQEKNRQAQGHRLALWNAGVHLLLTAVQSELAHRLEESRVQLQTRAYDPLSVDDFIDLCEGRFVRLSWAWTCRLEAPGMPPIERLVWAGAPGALLRERLVDEPGRPALLWSARNPSGYPPWVPLRERSPGGEQMTILGDRWLVARAGKVLEHSPSELAVLIAGELIALTVPKSGL
jgi:Fic family protein